MLHDLPKQAISFAHDSAGKRFVHINKQYITKNVKVSLSSKEYENLSQARNTLVHSSLSFLAWKGDILVRDEDMFVCMLFSKQFCRLSQLLNLLSY